MSCPGYPDYQYLNRLKREFWHLMYFSKVGFFLFVFILSILLFSTRYNARQTGVTITANSCNLTDVQAAIDNGADRVLIPAGSCVWNAPLVIRQKSITLIGNSTVIFGPPPSSTSPSTSEVMIDLFDRTNVKLEGDITFATVPPTPVPDPCLSIPSAQLATIRVTGWPSKSNGSVKLGWDTKALRVKSTSWIWSDPEHRNRSTVVIELEGGCKVKRVKGN